MTTRRNRLSDIYREELGPDRVANYDTPGGAQYWIDEHDPQTDADWDDIRRMIRGYDEAQKYRGEVAGWGRAGQVTPGGVDPTRSLASSWANDSTNTWLDNFATGGSLAPSDPNNILSTIRNTLTNINPDGGYFEVDPDGGGDGDGSVTPPPTGGWWTEFADAQAFKDFLTGDQTTSSDGMGDFMKFMMLMSIMRPGGGYGGGGYGGYGGSQYGYGGLNPGGVMQAYDPLANLQNMGTWFKDNFGSGGATTSTINAT